MRRSGKSRSAMKGEWPDEESKDMDMSDKSEGDPEFFGTNQDDMDNVF